MRPRNMLGSDPPSMCYDAVGSSALAVHFLAHSISGRILRGSDVCRLRDDGADGRVVGYEPALIERDPVFG